MDRQEKESEALTLSSSGSAELAWASSLVSEALEADCLAVGVASGSGSANDARTIDRLLFVVSELLERSGQRTLSIRLEMVPARRFGRSRTSSSASEEQRIPVAKRSPLGPWSEVSIPVSGRAKATWQLRQLPEWLPIWKDAFKLILVDLGPISSPESRAVGRLCDGNYVLLGPESCGSAEWIMQHTAWHNRVGSVICGSIVASLTKAA